MKGPDPQITLAIFVNAVDLITTKGTRVLRIVLVMDKTAAPRIQTIESIARKPQGPAAILIDARHDIGAQGAGVVGIVPVVSQSMAVIPGQACAPEPHEAMLVLCDGIERSLKSLPVDEKRTEANVLLINGWQCHRAARHTGR